MDLRYVFNEDVFNYDRARPSYPQELYQDIICYTDLDCFSTALEIGIGTGQATLPILQTGCKVTAVELGEDLAAFSRIKFENHNNIRIVTSDFENFVAPDNERYDMIYAATAFHWIDPIVGLLKIKDLLKPNATVALFWNHPYPNREDDPVNLANRKVYQKYRPSDNPLSEFSEKDCQKWKSQLERSGFTDVKTSLYHSVRTLTTDDYICLLNTYSDHLMLPPAIKDAFESDMKKAINDLGGKIHIYDTIDLYLARKPKGG